MEIVIIFSLLIDSLLIISFSGKYGNYLLLIIIWWHFWLFISTLSVTGLYIPKDDTYWLFILLLFTVSLGGVSYNLIKNSDIKNSYWRTNKQIYKLDLLNSFLLKLNYILLPIVLFFFIKAIIIMLTVDSLALYRDYALGIVEDTQTIIYINGVIKLFYKILISPVIMTSFFIALAINIFLDKSKLLVLTVCMLFLEAITVMGRFAFYQVAVMLVILYIYKNKSSLISIFNFNLIIRLGIIFFIVIAIDSIRSSSSDLDVKKIINNSFINYHTVGFVIYDQEYNDPKSLLNIRTTYGEASLGAIADLTTLVLRRLDKNIESIPNVVGTYLHEARIVGYSDEGHPQIYNAFATALYSLFLDGGILLVGVAGMLYGFLLTKFSIKSIIYQEPYSLVVLLLLIYIGVFGLFQPILTSAIWLYFILSFILFKIKFNGVIYHE